MKRAILLVVLLLLAFAALAVPSVHSVDKSQEVKPASKLLSPDEIRQLNRNIQWIQKNSSEIDRRMFDLGSKQFEVSWTIWYSWYLFIAILLALGGTAYYGVYTTLRRQVQKAAKEVMEEEVLYLKTVIHRSAAYLALMHAEDPTDSPRKHYLALGTKFAEDSYKRADELIKQVQRGGRSEENPNLETYQGALATAQSNLAWAISQKEKLDDSDKREARRLARAFYEFATKSDRYHLIDTYAWVLILCGADEDEKKQGREILGKLIKREDLPPEWREGRRQKFRGLFGEDP